MIIAVRLDGGAEKEILETGGNAAYSHNHGPGENNTDNGYNGPFPL